EAEALETRAVRYEGLAELVEIVSPGIAKPTEKDAQLQRGRAQMPDAAAVEPLDAMRCLEVTVDVNGLVEIELAIGTPTQRMHHVVGVLGAKAGKDNALLIRFAVAIGVLEMKQLRALANIRAAIARHDRCGNEQAVG